MVLALDDLVFASGSVATACYYIADGECRYETCLEKRFSNWEVVIKSWQLFQKIQETESQLFFFQNQPNPMGGNPFSNIPTEANPSAPQSFKLCNTWMAEMCLWSPWIHLGDLVAQDAKNQKRENIGKERHVHLGVLNDRNDD